MVFVILSALNNFNHCVSFSNTLLFFFKTKITGSVIDVNFPPVFCATALLKSLDVDVRAHPLRNSSKIRCDTIRDYLWEK